MVTTDRRLPAGTTDRRHLAGFAVPPASSRPFFLLLLLLCFAAIAGAEDIRATATVDSAKILIGDQVRLKIEVVHSEGYSATAPANLPELLKPYEVISAGKMETTHSETGPVSTMTIVLTAFEAGTHAIPALPIEVRKNGKSEPRTIQTAPVSIEVKNVEVDTEKDIKDVKPPQEVPFSWQEALPYALGAAAAVALAWLVHYIWKKRRKGETILPATPPRPAHELALEALRALESKRLWQGGLAKEYHSELTDILRTYIERKYEVPAMEMTTEDILAPGVSKRWSDGLRKDLSDVLTLADFVKFARMHPAPADNERSIRLAFSFVEATRNSAAAAGAPEAAPAPPVEERPQT